MSCGTLTILNPPEASNSNFGAYSNIPRSRTVIRMMMSKLPEITDLFTKLASHLQSGIPHEEACEPAISSLNQSLNLNESSRVRVLDTALSLMCFKSPQVFDSVIEYLVKTIVSVLSSSISCKVLRFQRYEFLQIGSSICSYDCVELIEACNDVLGRLEGHGMLTPLLLCAVLRVAISASCYKSVFPIAPILNVKSVDRRHTAASKLRCLLPNEIAVKNHEIPLRLLLWYLDPLTLKHDILKILCETVQRPFLCLKKELHDRMDWHSVIICLVLSPTMFIEARALLHNWFLVTGLASVRELQVELVSSVLEILTRPMWWGISVEVGPKLPFSHAYFPGKHHLLGTLAGPLSCESFLCLVHLVSKPVSHARRHSDSTVRQSATKAGMIDHKSIWGMVMNFPDWFFFAAVLLFSGEKFLSGYTSGVVETDQTHYVDPRSAAARFLAWIMSPISEAHRDLLIDCLTRISESWTLKQRGSDTHNKDTAGCRRKLKKPKCRDKKDCPPPKEYDCQTMGLWLKEFQDSYLRYWNKTVDSCASTEAKSHVLSLQQNLLFRRIPLGILIGCCNYLDEEGCELLLHYAATGAILPSTETRNARLNNINQKSDGHDDDGDSIMWTEESNKRKEAVAGACLVLDLLDVVENMSLSIFETEESGLDFNCQVKVKAGKYLVKCINKLLQLTTDGDEGGVLMLMDLRRRLLQLEHSRKEVFQCYKALDDVVNTLNCKISYENI
ncbi:hypothetical protein HHK36_014296 [Tetracentron sinense]|uniref:Uncharacterized protein n=1 Tax=Tetracentron sinense TaxID=13715 RepID=A0A835DF11_TETSI|nr:hypothetical protein HHK36_014296 [Tetracentron sinense]